MNNQKQPYDRWFENYLVVGFFLSMASVFATIYWWQPRDANSFWPALAISTAVCTIIPALVNWLTGKSLARLIKCTVTSLVFCTMVNTMFGAIMAMTVLDAVSAAPEVQQFVENDFDWVDEDGKGSIDSRRLDSIIKERDSLASALQQLSGVEKTIDSLPVSAPSRLLAEKGLLLAEAELKLKLLPQDTYNRLRTTRYVLHQVGQPSTAPGATEFDFVASKAQLTQYKARVEAK